MIGYLVTLVTTWEEEGFLFDGTVVCYPVRVTKSSFTMEFWTQEAFEILLQTGTRF